MLFVHENNLKKKILENHKGIGKEIEAFYSDIYWKVREQLLDIDFSKGDDSSFQLAADIINGYYVELDSFIKKYPVASQSKFRSTFLEEISTYLFEDLEYVKNGSLGIYNKRIYAGMKIGSHLEVNIMDKDVDFCLGKKVKIQIGNQEYEIILPIIAVEVKTYLDATMFGEAQYSSRLLKNATPSVKTYVLMETNQVKEEKIVCARHDAVLNEMFVLRRDKKSPIDSHVLKDYYYEICNALDELSIEREITIPGRLFQVEK